jgi:hypothetical protein
VLERRVLDKALVYRGRSGAAYGQVREPVELRKRTLGISNIQELIWLNLMRLDLCTTSVFEKNSTSTIINTFMAPTTTVTDPFFTTTTKTL